MVHGRHGRQLRAVAGSILLTIVTGCSSPGRPTASGDAATDSPTQRTTAPSAQASASPRGALPSPWASASGTAAQRSAAASALTAYNGMWDDLIAVAAISDFKDPRLMQHMLYQPLTDWAQQFADSKRDGIVAAGRPTWSPEVVSVTPKDKPNRVEIADCVDATDWLQVHAASGKPVDDVPGGRHRSEAAVTFVAVTQSWMVTQQIYGKAGSC